MTLSINRLNPNCTTFTVGNRTWYWSFNRCEAYEERSRKGFGAFEYDAHPQRFLRDKCPSPTTERHLEYMGVSDWPRVDDATFEKMAGGE